MEAYFRRTLNGWEPFDAECEEACKKFALGTIHQLPLVRARDAKFLAKYQVLCSVIFKHQDHFLTMASFKEWSRKTTGMTEKFTFFDGTTSERTISPSFKNVDNDLDFDEKYFQPMLTIGVGLMNGTTEDEIRDRVEQVLRFA